MKKNKAAAKGDISKLIETLLDKKIDVLEDEMKNLVLKISEEYLSKAMKELINQDNKGSLSNQAEDSFSKMNMSQSQVFGSLLSGINKYFDSM